MKQLRLLANASICLAILLLVASAPVTATDLQAPSSEPAIAPSASSQLEGQIEPAEERQEGFLYEMGAVELAGVGDAYVCPSESACTSGGTVFLDCSHLNCAFEDLACVGGDGSPCSGTCACYSWL